MKGRGFLRSTGKDESLQCLELAVAPVDLASDPMLRAMALSSSIRSTRISEPLSFGSNVTHNGAVTVNRFPDGKRK